MAAQRTYTLGADVYSGFITLEDGMTIFIEYNTETKGSTNGLPYLKDFLEDITVRACLQNGYNYALIRSILHSTAIKRGKKQITQPHVTITAGFYVDNTPTQIVAGHIFTQGFNPSVQPQNWYDNVVIERVKWRTEQGSSDGSASVSSSNGGRSSSYDLESQASSSTTVEAGWYSDPWAAETGKTTRYWDGNEWTSHAA